MPLHLSSHDRRLLSGAAGDGTRLAMRLVVEAAEIAGAPRLIDIGSAHVGSCYSAGATGLDFARRLADSGTRVAVPTTLNVAATDLLHCTPLERGNPSFAEIRELVDLYLGMGCEETLTCAPYHLPERPGLGDQVAWYESNAVVFANSVLGARTELYGEFIDVCAAVTGRVPDAGLHRTENRRAEVLFDLISFWGGVDPATGVIVDRHHPQAGASMTGTVLVLPGTRGSAGGSGTLAESLRLGTGPAAIVLPSANRSVVIGVLVADELYGRPVPVLVVPGDAHASFRTGKVVTIATGGRLRELCAAAVVVGCDADHRATGGTHVRRTDTA